MSHPNPPSSPGRPGVSFASRSGVPVAGRCSTPLRRALPGLLGLLLCGWAGPARAAEATPLLDQWLHAQAEVRTWSAEFTQTRSLKALKEPLRTPGRLWFAAPDRFRWELGEPARTIALRNAKELLVIYPRLKRVERYPLQEGAGETWRGALALLDAGFATNRAELEARFTVAPPQVEDGRLLIRLTPRSAAASRFMTGVQLELEPATFEMRANEMRFADGSSLRNDFTNAVVNPPLPDDRFEYPLPPDFQVVEPGQP
ncbi:MAG: outer membrane lipoprotein carrier protein LolA [Verrucomicrobiales bacterium]|nr:outer membrane lipoprotein carrier protein LolA [Verrucomicrobiales bacterium]MCP5527496.1 outer membrane lipoprotein carrier protein LolA [Verrucomicrobiales bacterium]